MMKKEFEKIAGYEVSNEDYKKIIEPMYMAVDLSKEEFVKIIDKKRFALPTKAELIKKMRKIANEIAETVEINGAYALQKELEEVFKNFEKRFGWDHHYDLRMYTATEIRRGCTFPVQIVFYSEVTKAEERIDLLPKAIKEFGNLYGIEKAC